MQSIEIGGGGALAGASDDLKKDRDIVVAAIEKNCYAFKHADESLRSNRDVALIALNKSPDIPFLDSVGYKLLGDKNFMLEVFKVINEPNPKKNKEEFRKNFLDRTSRELFDDSEFVLSLARIDYQTVFMASRRGYLTALEENVTFFDKMSEINPKAVEDLASHKLQMKLRDLALGHNPLSKAFLGFEKWVFGRK